MPEDYIEVIQTPAELNALYKLVDAFADAMKTRLDEKFAEGFTGWDDPNWTKDQINGRLQESAFKPDENHRVVDTANFCAFLWNRLRG
jgi:hypothetical protein